MSLYGVGLVDKDEGGEGGVVLEVDVDCGVLGAGQGGGQTGHGQLGELVDDIFEVVFDVAG